jgi:hypothetical protein
MLSKPSKPHREITDQRERVGVGAGLAKPLVRISTGTRAAGSGPEREEAPANAGQRAEASPLWAGSQLAGGSVKPGAS